MEVVAEQFIGHDLVDNILEVRTVDVFMGFHGAGFVNSFYLQPVCTPGHGHQKTVQQATCTAWHTGLLPPCVSSACASRDRYMAGHLASQPLLSHANGVLLTACAGERHDPDVSLGLGAAAAGRLGRP